MYNNNHNNILRIKKRKWLHLRTIKRVLIKNKIKIILKKEWRNQESVWKFKKLKTDVRSVGANTSGIWWVLLECTIFLWLLWISRQALKTVSNNISLIVCKCRHWVNV